MDLQENLSVGSTAAFSPEDLRKSFLVSGMFAPNEIRLRGWHEDRTVMAGAMPLGDSLRLPTPPELRSSYFLERRELGIINVGGAGSVVVDGEAFPVGRCDALYVGRGKKDVLLSSQDSAHPARFWMVSYPAHCAYPTRLVTVGSVEGDALGTQASANRRRLRKMIHPGTVQTCQLVMGFTSLEAGSVWNSMPPHTHLRRSEVYLYFDVPEGQAVFHFMGEPSRTRHLVVHEAEAVLSPPWSIHCGCGTAAYSFVWCMGGENQEFTDMDPAPTATLS